MGRNKSSDQGPQPRAAASLPVLDASPSWKLRGVRGPDCSLAYRTERGQAFLGSAEAVLNSGLVAAYKGAIQLIFTSPPFPLNRKKKYGNLQGEEYIDWLASFGPLLRDFLTPDGSIVIELGNAWEAGRPVMSTLALRALLAFLDKSDLRLCQQFICYNPARLPSPAQWVNVERIRVKDAFAYVWWLSPVDRPKADNRRVLMGIRNNPSARICVREVVNEKCDCLYPLGWKALTL